MLGNRRSFWEKGTPLGWGEVDDNESICAIHRAVDLGINFFDTANVYGAGHSERVLALGKRKDVVIATKFNAVFDERSREVTGSDSTPAGFAKHVKNPSRDLIQITLTFTNFTIMVIPQIKLSLYAKHWKVGKEGKIRAYGWSTILLIGQRSLPRGKLRKHTASIECAR